MYACIIILGNKRKLSELREIPGTISQKPCLLDDSNSAGGCMSVSTSMIDYSL